MLLGHAINIVEIHQREMRVRIQRVVAIAKGKQRTCDGDVDSTALSLRSVQIVMHATERGLAPVSSVSRKESCSRSFPRP